MFAKKRGQVEENVHFEKLEQKYQTALEKAIQTNVKTAPKRSERHQTWWQKKNNINVSAPQNGLPAKQSPNVSFMSNKTNQRSKKFSAKCSMFLKVIER